MARQGLPKPPIEVDDYNSWAWREWFRKLAIRVRDAGQILFSGLDFTDSNITSLTTRNHNDLQNKQGGTTDEYYHVTSDIYSELQGGIYKFDLILMNESHEVLNNDEYNVLRKE